MLPTSFRKKQVQSREYFVQSIGKIVFVFLVQRLNTTILSSLSSIYIDESLLANCLKIFGKFERFTRARWMSIFNEKNTMIPFSRSPQFRWSRFMKRNEILEQWSEEGWKRVLGKVSLSRREKNNSLKLLEDFRWEIFIFFLGFASFSPPNTSVKSARSSTFRGRTRREKKRSQVYNRIKFENEM